MYKFCRKRQGQLRLISFYLALLLGNLLLSPASALAAVDPDPPLYDNPPGPAFVPRPVANLPSSPVHQKFGIAAHPWWLATYLDRFVTYYKDLHITTVRLPIEWKTLEPAPGVYDWTLNDTLLNRLAQEGFEVVTEFVTIPAWASTNPAECAKDDLACIPRTDPETKTRLAALTEALIKRYPAIRYWEFWNEPEYWPHFGKRDIEDYAPWLRVFYDAAKRADPTIMVAATSLTGPFYIDWLYQYSDDNWGAANRPFDAIAYHPYNHDGKHDKNGHLLSLNKARVDQLRLIMVAKGDGAKPIWLTELGWETKEASPQIVADELIDAFDFVASRPYVTMLHIHMLHDWEWEDYGLMSTVPDVFNTGKSLTPDTRFVPKQPYYDTYKFYYKRPIPLLSSLAQANVTVFPETSHTVREVFKNAWEHGSLTLFGYPRTGQFYERNLSDGRFYLVQYFERVRMEYHPEYVGTPNEVLFGLLGNQLLYERGWLNERGEPLDGFALPENAPSAQQLPATSQWFPQTGHLVSGLFLDAWKQQGGLAIVGFPKTSVFEELNPDDGQRYQVQYFERARLELHPAQAGRAAYIAFGLLGNDRLRLQYRLDKTNQPVLSDYYNPALPEFTH